MLGFQFRTQTAGALIVLLSLALLEVKSERVLVLCPLSSQSHQNVFEGIYSGLAEKGHEITVVTSGKPSKRQQKNVKEVLVFDAFDYFPTFSTLELRKAGIIGLMTQDTSHVDRHCHEFYESAQVNRLMTEKFDVILYDLIANHCVYGLIHKLQAPYIAVSTCEAPDPFTKPFGNRLPTSFVPDFMLPYTDDMTFVQRTLNLIARPISNIGFAMFNGQAETVFTRNISEMTSRG